MGFFDAIIGGLQSFAFNVLPFLFVLTVVVFFHELGHFLVARWCGVAVRAFSIGFGPEIFAFEDRRGTRWRLAWIPLGGYVKFIDDDNPASAPDPEKLKKMSPEQLAGSFQLKPLWQKAAVVAAGPIANFILTCVIFAVLLGVMGEHVRRPQLDVIKPGSVAAAAGLNPKDMVLAVNGHKIASTRELMLAIRSNAGEPLVLTIDRAGRKFDVTVVPKRKKVPTLTGVDEYAGVLGLAFRTPAQIGQVLANGAAARAGLKQGDLILAVNGKPVSDFGALRTLVEASPGKLLRTEILRNGEKLVVNLTPDAKTIQGPDGQSRRVGRIGIASYKDPGLWTYKHYGPLAAMWKGVQDTYNFLATTLHGLYRIVMLKESPSQIGGPLMIAKVSAEVAAIGFDRLLWLTAVISASIGLLNLFPIPVLDGGHLLFYAAEAIRGRPLSERTLEIGYRIGFVLIMTLMVFVLYSDIVKYGGSLLGIS